MKHWMRYLGLGGLFYLLFLVALFPATQAYRFAAEPLARAMPVLKLAQLEGTVWSGQAGMVVYRQALLGQASWQVSPFALLLGKARLTALLQSDEGYLQSRVAAPLAGGPVELSGLEGRMPVTELARFAPYMPLVMDGVVSLDLPKLVVDSAGRILAAEGSVIWHQAAMSAPQALALGDLLLQLRTEGEGQVAGDISDRGGPLKVEGALQLSPDGAYRINGTVAAAPDAPATLVKSLGWLGKPDSQGRYRLDYSGRM